MSPDRAAILEGILADKGVPSSEATIINDHVFVALSFLGLKSSGCACIFCGIMKNRDGLHGQCSGRVAIALRSGSTRYLDTLIEVSNTEYKSPSSGLVMRHGTPADLDKHRNPLTGRWCLVSTDGQLLDHDQYRNDLAERFNLRLTRHP